MSRPSAPRRPSGRCLTTDIIRKMDRVELEDELFILDITADQSETDQHLRDKLCDALDALPHPDK